jgi:hypothetical protein
MKHYLGICLVLITLAAVVLFGIHSCSQTVDHTIDHVRDAFSDVLNVKPQITVNQRVILTQTAPIAELAVVQKEEDVTIAYDAHYEVLNVQVPLTEKKLTAEATYRVKAGFDLRESFSVEIDPVTRAIHAAMPHAKILSIEQIGDPVFHGEDGALDRVTDDERTEILKRLNAAAHDTAEKSGLKADAEKQVTDRLQELLKHNGQPLQIQWLEQASISNT